MVYDNRRSPVGLRLFYAPASGEAASLPPGGRWHGVSRDG